ncbi:UNVERIFIED_CONTAM: hypothetical protein Sradi_5960200 [Sesamum radiatum]|uniref:Uncharacterized protein n=1 Tax=Sesamum radiatum TaxID=300843 RepID=A0AAW2KER5_SESRA
MHLANCLRAPEKPKPVGLTNPPEWVEWRETSGSLELPPTSDSSNTSSAAQKPPLPNGELDWN